MLWSTTHIQNGHPLSIIKIDSIDQSCWEGANFDGVHEVQWCHCLPFMIREDYGFNWSPHLPLLGCYLSWNLEETTMVSVDLVDMLCPIDKQSELFRGYGKVQTRSLVVYDCHKCETFAGWLRNGIIMDSSTDCNNQVTWMRGLNRFNPQWPTLTSQQASVLQRSHIYGNHK